jgi:hypothetical protein
MAATVKSIDAEKRTVRFKTPSGRWPVVYVDERVEHLDRLRAGERVTAHYRAIGLRQLASPKSGAAGASSTRRAETLPASPSGFTHSLVATVTRVDRGKASAILQTPDGDPLEIRAKDPAMLEHVSVGDTVEVTYVEGRAVAIERGAPSMRRYDR